jgi:hypothetical protein
MGTILRIGLGRSISGKILERTTTWHNINTLEQWSLAVNECSLKRNSGKKLFLSKNGKPYQEITLTQLLLMKDKF